MNLQDQATLNRKKGTTMRLSNAIDWPHVETDRAAWAQWAGITLANAANWHGAQAAKAYRRRDLVTYLRHVRIADKLWRSIK
jgi:hypothetical protein